MDTLAWIYIIDYIYLSHCVCGMEATVDRLTSKGSKDRNLNPFDVLQLDTSATDAEIRHQWHRLCFLLHPDKTALSSVSADKVREAYDVVNNAYKLLCDADKKATVLGIIDEARAESGGQLQSRIISLLKHHAAVVVRRRRAAAMVVPPLRRHNPRVQLDAGGIEARTDAWRAFKNSKRY